MRRIQPSGAPEAMTILQETRQKVRECIQALPEDSRKLIEYAYFEGCTLQEAGARIGISKAWASRLHAKTLRHLASALRHKGVVE